MRYALVFLVLSSPLSIHAAYCPLVNQTNNSDFVCVKTYDDHTCNGQAHFRGAQYDVNMKRVVCLYDQGEDVYINAGAMHSINLKYKPGGKWEETSNFQYTCESNNPEDCPLQ